MTTPLLPGIVRKLGISLLAILPYVSHANPNSNDGAAVIDFERYPIGALEGVSGWKVEFGHADVVNSRFSSGSRAVALQAGVVEAVVVAPAFDTKPPAAVIRFSASGFKAVARPDSREFMNLAGALAAVVLDRPGVGRIWVYNAGDTKEVKWIPTAIQLPLDASGSVSGWVDLLVEIDFSQNLWSLTMGGGEQESGLKLEADSSAEGLFRFYGYADATWWMDDFTALSRSAGSVKSENALMKDRVNRHPARAPESLSLPAGVPSAQLTSPAAIAPAPSDPQRNLKPALRTEVYVNAQTGDDRNDGSQNTPVASLRAGFALLAAPGAVINIGDGHYRMPKQKFPAVRVIVSGRTFIH